MPHLRQGDVLSIAKTEEFDLAIVFGHLGYNHMDLTWQNFKQGIDFWNETENPFDPDVSDLPHQFNNNKWIWFVGAKENNGITDEDFQLFIVRALTWANMHQLRRVITNGIMDVDHGRQSVANRASDDRRTDLLFSLVRPFEEVLDVTLVSLNDVFVRRMQDINPAVANGAPRVSAKELFFKRIANSHSAQVLVDQVIAVGEELNVRIHHTEAAIADLRVEPDRPEPNPRQQNVITMAWRPKKGYFYCQSLLSPHECVELGISADSVQRNAGPLGSKLIIRPGVDDDAFFSIVDLSIQRFREQ